MSIEFKGMFREDILDYYEYHETRQELCLGLEVISPFEARIVEGRLRVEDDFNVRKYLNSLPKRYPGKV